MQRFEFRWQNFRSIEDTDWLRIKPITVIIGPNASGKTSLIAPLLLLKQTLESLDTGLALKTKGEYMDAGGFSDLVFRHDARRLLRLGLRTPAFRVPDERDTSPIDKYPPGEVGLTFDGGDDDELLLKQFSIRDTRDRRLLERNRLKAGGYSLVGFPTKGVAKTYLKAMLDSTPTHFLFSFQPIFRAGLHTRSTRKTRSTTIRLDSNTGRYVITLGVVSGWIEELLGNISYLGPLREHPKRLYEVSGERPSSVGVRGQHAPEILFEERNDGLLDDVNEWVSKFEFGYRIQCDAVAADAYRILLQRNVRAPKVNLADTGFGLSQVLPLIVQSYFGKPDSLLIAEQPEIHLNPRLQSLLADLFCSVAKRGRGILVETHSEHLLLRLRRLIATKQVAAKDVALYYVEKPRDRSVIQEIPIQQNGHIEPDRWPKGFFEDSLHESLALAMAQ